MLRVGSVVIHNARTVVTKQFTVTASPDFIVRFERFLALCQRNGAVGHSAVCALWVDGDGSDRPQFEPAPPQIEIGVQGSYPDQYEIAKPVPGTSNSSRLP